MNSAPSFTPPPSTQGRPRSARHRFLAALVAATLALVGREVSAETLQIPEGGRPVPLGGNRVACGDLPTGWGFSPDRRRVRPPETATATNRMVEIGVAQTPGGCARSDQRLTLLATGPTPEIDAASVVFVLDEGRLEFKGERLDGLQVLWQSGSEQGQVTCLAPVPVGKQQQCVVPMPRRLPAGTRLRWLPAHAQDGPGVASWDVQGLAVATEGLVLQPARYLLGQVFGNSETLDVSQGAGTIPLAHPEAVAAVDCGSSRCELLEGGVAVRGVPAQAAQLSVTARLAPRYYLRRGDRLETSHTESFTLLRCPLVLQSGPPMRDVEHPQLLVRVAEHCRSQARLRWFVGTEPATVVREEHTADGSYVLLRASQLAGGSVTIVATRVDTMAGVVGSVTSPTIPPPRPHSAIELPGHGPVNFIPTNREAVWSVAGIADARLVPIGLPGAYSVRREKTRTLLRGDRHSGGFVNLRFAYRRSDLPRGFEDVDLAVLNEAVERPLREASIPVPFAATPGRPEPLAELQCADATGRTVALAPGTPASIPYAARETCRMLLHQERLTPEDGQQEVVLEIDVTRPSGSRRANASLNEHMVLRPGGQLRVVYLKGISEQFDQVSVRLSHVVDEARYLLGSVARPSAPSAQWSAVVEGSRARLYVSLSVPAGLYRINEPAASLTLNFGVLGRITWLDRHGKEGLLGLETGVLGASLIPQQYNNRPAFPPTLVTLLGVGLRVEVGQGAAIGVHLWGAYEFRGEYSYRTSETAAPRTATRWSLLFGPSISIGNVGTNL